MQHALQNVQVGLVEGFALEPNFVALDGRNQRPFFVDSALLANAEKFLPQDGIGHAAHIIGPQLQPQLAIWRSRFLRFGLRHLAGSGFLQAGNFFIKVHA